MKSPTIMSRTGKVLTDRGFCLNHTLSMLSLTLVPDFLNDRKDHLQQKIGTALLQSQAILTPNAVNNKT